MNPNDIKLASDFLHELSLLQNEKTNSKALDLIYSTMEDEVLLKKNFALGNHILEQVITQKFNLTIILGFLTVTLGWKKVLPAREKLYSFVKDQVLRNHADRTTSLLSGLE